MVVSGSNIVMIGRLVGKSRAFSAFLQWVAGVVQALDIIGGNSLKDKCYYQDRSNNQGIVADKDGSLGQEEVRERIIY